MSDATAEAEFLVPEMHPALPGHFPGRPVVPGVVLLDEVFAAARRTFGLGPAGRIGRAKFAAPVLPGQRVIVQLTQSGVAKVSFACRTGGALVLSGEAEFVASGQAAAT